ncbi:N-acetylmuramoyl-L-alanine amidase [Romboutsia lituseburensis]|uniref:N-acetylmuramoyl-L-alanine amidase n=1 Tax=Romboutsia lituseburensis TaxID=1537 RepID=UPI0022EA80E1|nr:N-acetylmuramoyl-L-alanine amidase [Romboutsia lituseburensis]
MKKIVNKRATQVAALSILSSLPILSKVDIVNANNNIELEFESIADKYDANDIIVENGVSIKKGETLDLSQYSGWEMSNNETVDIDENGIVYPIKEGTVFLSNKIDNKIHILEVYVSGDKTIMYANQRANSVNRDFYKVFIDPGHGGSDNGASAFGKFEDELSLQIAKSVELKLKQKGIQVKMSRTSDVFIPLGERAQMANTYGADAFISIHLNSSSNESANGIETYHHTQKTSHRPYSTGIHNNAIKSTQGRDRGVKSANFVVLRETNMVSSLFETGFISNAQENNKLSDPVYQDKLAVSIANGIESYLKENVKLKPGSQIPEEKPPINSNVNYGVVTASNLNVRSGYGTSYSVIGSLSKGSKVEILESKDGWYKIKYGSRYGFISSSYIKNSNGSDDTINSGEKPPISNSKNGVVTATSLNIRSGYGSSYSKIGSLTKGSKVEIVESKNGWHKIKYGNRYGYVSGEYISTSNTNQPQITPPSSNGLKCGVVTATSLNVRNGYSSSYSKIGSLTKGSTVEIVENKNGWYKIKYKNGYGYVSGQYIKI